MDDFRLVDKKNIWHPFTPLVGAADPIFIQSADGVYLRTADGREIIDAVSSWWVNLHGHSNKIIASAIAEQALKLEHVIFAGFTHEPAITLSENLLSILPDNQTKVFFSDNGSTAVEVAVKMALQFWYNKNQQRTKIIAIHGAYHGDTFGSMSVGERGIFTDPFQRHLFDVQFIDFPEKGNEDAVREQFKNLVNDPQVAAFIYEPLVQAAAGMRMYLSSLLDELIEEAHQHDVLCIADEVFTGFGRTGKLFASLHGKHSPDIMAISKGITGGSMPLGVTSCSSKITEAFSTDDFLKTFFHGHSYTANPLACAAANASFALLMSKECNQAIARISSSHKNFEEKIAGHRVVKEVRTLGTIIAIELRTEEGTSYSHSIRKKIYDYFLSRDLLLRPLGNIIYILPPYVMTDGELQRIYNAIEEFLNELMR